MLITYAFVSLLIFNLGRVIVNMWVTDKTDYCVCKNMKTCNIRMYANRKVILWNVRKK